MSLQFSRTALRNVCLTRNLHFSFLFGTTTTRRSIFPTKQDSGTLTRSPGQLAESSFKGRAGEMLSLLSAPRPVPRRSSHRLQKKELLEVAGRAKTLKPPRRAPKPFLFREHSLWANELQIIPLSPPLQRSPNDTLSVNLMCFKLSPCLATYLECPLRTAKKSQAGKKAKASAGVPGLPPPRRGGLAGTVLPPALLGKDLGRHSSSRTPGHQAGFELFTISPCFSPSFHVLKGIFSFFFSFRFAKALQEMI